MPYAKHALDARGLWSSQDPDGTDPYDRCRCGKRAPFGQIEQHVQAARRAARTAAT